MLYEEWGICRRTVAVSRGYLTTVLVTVSAAPATRPERDSWRATLLALLLFLFVPACSATAKEGIAAAAPAVASKAKKVDRRETNTSEEEEDAVEATKDESFFVR